MKGFPAPPRQEVILKRNTDQGETTLYLFLSPTPIGYSELLERVYPAPLFYVNSKPEGADPHRASEHYADKNLILLGKALGDQLSTPFPTSLQESTLKAYLVALKAELAEANLTSGDINLLLSGLAAVNKGLGKVALGNG